MHAPEQPSDDEHLKRHGTQGESCNRKMAGSGCQAAYAASNQTVSARAPVPPAWAKVYLASWPSRAKSAPHEKDQDQTATAKDRLLGPCVYVCAPRRSQRVDRNALGVLLPVRGVSLVVLAASRLPAFSQPGPECASKAIQSLRLCRKGSVSFSRQAAFGAQLRYRDTLPTKKKRERSPHQSPAERTMAQ